MSEVQKDSPASAAGIKQGDVIIHLNGIKLEDVSDLRNKVALIEPESTAVLLVIRDGREKKIQVTIGEQPSNFSKKGGQDSRTESLEKFGLTLQKLSADIAEKLGYDKKSGLLISDVKSGSPAETAGLKPGQLVEEVNKTKVANLKDLKKVLKRSPDSDKILLRVRSGNYSTYVVRVAK